ncbi:MAG: pyridoxal-phosphate dependent enzyme [Gemmatimonadota bacterium]
MSGSSTTISSSTERLPALAGACAEADRRIRPVAIETRCITCDDTTWSGGAVVHLKLENEQRTGSFKLRGAANRLLSMSGAELARGVVAASSGNHGAAVAAVGRELGIVPRILVHASADAYKVERIRGLGAEVIVLDEEALAVEEQARALATAEGATYVSPYNDHAVVAGQGTVAIEVLRQVGSPDAVFVSVGGGGLIGGVAAVIRSHSPATRVFGVVPKASPVMMQSVRAGRIVDVPVGDTLSDATAGGIEANSVTFPLCRDLVDDWIAVSEDEIAVAMRWYAARYGTAVEGAAGVALAGFGRQRPELAGKRVVVIICSGNVSPAMMQRVFGRDWTG